MEEFRSRTEVSDVGRIVGFCDKVLGLIDILCWDLSEEWGKSWWAPWISGAFVGLLSCVKRLNLKVVFGWIDLLGSDVSSGIEIYIIDHREKVTFLLNEPFEAPHEYLRPPSESSSAITIGDLWFKNKSATSSSRELSSQPSAELLHTLARFPRTTSFAMQSGKHLQEQH